MSSELLSDSYLKCLAWALSDREPIVRMQAVRALTAPYSHRQISEGIDNFVWECGGRLQCLGVK